MDLKKLASIVSQCQPLWDRSHEKFRDQGCKAAMWKKIGIELNTTDSACRDAYKALREKYIREREKVQQYGNYCKPWELLEHLKFLDPYITTRNSCNTTAQFEEYVAVKQDPTSDSEYIYQEDKEGSNYSGIDNSTLNFCKSLIKMVYESRPLWDRNYKDYNDKQLKDRLWMGIANVLKSDVTSCALKWKSLREKYIRQKQKYSEGEYKWEFLDDLSFLDSVILYRKRHWKPEETNNLYSSNDIDCVLSQSNFDYEIVDDCTDDSISNQLFNSNQKQTPPPVLLPHTPDSTLEIQNKAERKRTLSNSSETSYNNTKQKCSNQERTPEQIYGEFVAAMLATKPDNERKSAMIEIMRILARPSG